MDDESLRFKLNELHHAIADAVLDVVQNGRPGEDGTTIAASNDDFRTALQLLKQNNISVAAMPKDPLDALRKVLVGSRIPPGHLEARLKASPHLAALESADRPPAPVTVEWEAKGQGLDAAP
jgi:hypothetical protein